MSKPKLPQFKVKWFSANRLPKDVPDLRFPEGVDVDCTLGRPGCTVQLEHPTKGCGQYYVECRQCGINAIITTAGRFDDPRSVKLPCKSKKRK